MSTSSSNYTSLVSTREEGEASASRSSLRTPNFGEFYKGELRRIPIPRTWVNEGKKEGRVRLDWSDAAGSGLWLLEDYEQEEDEEEDALGTVHDDPHQGAAVAPRRVRQREDIDQGRWDHPRLVQVVDREQEAVGNPVPAPERTLHPRQQQPAEQQLFSEGGVEHEQGDDDSEPDPVARHERLTRLGPEEDVEVVAGYGWDHTEKRDGTLGGVEHHERNDDEPEPATDASCFGAAR